VKVLDLDVYRYVVSSKNTAKIKKFLVGKRKCKVNKRPGLLCPDLVYTFFHPLLKDEEETSIHIQKLKGLSFIYPFSINNLSPFSFLNALLPLSVLWLPGHPLTIALFRGITGLVSSL
jgi:hypothetical protein